MSDATANMETSRKDPERTDQYSTRLERLEEYMVHSELRFIGLLAGLKKAEARLTAIEQHENDLLAEIRTCMQKVKSEHEETRFLVGLLRKCG